MEKSYVICTQISIHKRPITNTIAVMKDDNFVNIFVFVLIFVALIVISLFAGYVVRMCNRKRNERRELRREIYFENIRVIALGTTGMMERQISS